MFFFYYFGSWHCKTSMPLTHLHHAHLASFRRHIALLSSIVALPTNQSTKPMAAKLCAGPLSWSVKLAPTGISLHGSRWRGAKSRVVIPRRAYVSLPPEPTRVRVIITLARRQLKGVRQVTSAAVVRCPLLLQTTTITSSGP